MNWLQILQKTYDKSRTLVGCVDKKGCILLPIAHSTQNAQIEIVINLKGEFISARKVEKAEAVTIIPVTEDSGTRSSDIVAHPLFDKLSYIAGDYPNYFVKKKIDEYFETYINQLKMWVDSGCHEYVKAVYDYVNKKTMVKDLVANGILLLDERGKLDSRTKIEGIAQADAFVRFRIQDEGVPGTGEIWRELAVYDDYIKYYLSQFKTSGLDYITGTNMPCSEKQPSKIRHSGDKAKLISANDSSGFTYRGRFASKEEAVSVGYVPSQEAHNALRWLIERQGYRKYGMSIVTWDPEDKEVPDWINADNSDYVYEGMTLTPDLAESYAEQVKKAIRGRYSEFDNPSEEIVVMGVDAATPGRLSVTYFQHMRGSSFLDAMVHWYSTCYWKMGYIKSEIARNKPITPRPEDIVLAAYGVERNGFLTVDDKLMQDALYRLIPCIIERKKMPLDIIRAAVDNASRPLAFSQYNRRKILEITCALINKKYQDRGRKEFGSMALDRSCDKRDYLYGRLLAVAHKMEYDTFSEEERGRRETNAERYRSMMIKNPTKIWLIIDEKLSPYKKKLKAGLQIKYQKEMQEIYDTFKLDDYSKKGRLGELFLIGYNCELSELWKSTTTNEE